MILEYLKRLILKAFLIIPHDGPEDNNGDGSGGGGTETAVIDDKGDPGEISNEELFKDTGVPLELWDDPEIRSEVLNQRKSEDGDIDDDKTPDDDKGKDGKLPEDKTIDKDKSGKSKDDKTDGEDDDFEIEFENDVEIGDIKISKDTLKTLGKDGIESLGKLKVTLNESNEEVSQYKKDKKVMMEDPVIADRMNRIREGTANKPYTQHGITVDTKNAIVSRLIENGLDQSVAETIFKETILKEINKDFELNLRASLNNSLLSYKQTVDAEKVVDEGKKIIQEIADMNKKLSYEQVFNWCIDPARKGSGEKGGMTYKDLVLMKVRLGPEAIYASIAKANDLPVIINTKERDKKIIQKDRDKYFDAIGAKKVAKAMKKSKPGTEGQTDASIDKDGAIIDKGKLNDQEYIGDILSKANTVDEMMDIQRSLIKQSTSN